MVAAHVFYDTTRSDYYIAARVSEGAFRLKRLFAIAFDRQLVSQSRFHIGAATLQLSIDRIDLGKQIADLREIVVVALAKLAHACR